MTRAPRKPPDHSQAREIRARLADRYCPPEWYFGSEVTLGRRRLDAVAFRLWGGSGKGYQLLAFEIKVSRSDWARELSEFDKADTALAHVDQFYVVAPVGVVPVSELPRDWGLLEWSGKVLRAKVHPPKRHAGTELDRELAARLLTKEQARNSEKWQREHGELTATLRAEIEPRLREELAGARVQEQAAAYRRLLVDVGLSCYANPVEILQRAIAVDRALRAMPTGRHLEVVQRELAAVATHLSGEAAQLSTALEQFRASIGPESHDTVDHLQLPVASIATAGAT